MQAIQNFRRRVVLGLFVTLIACSSGDKKKEDPFIFIGKHKEILVDKWGLPTRTAPDSNGGEIWTYELTKEAEVFGTGDSKSYKETRLFFVDSTGTIYQTKKDVGR